MGNSKGNGQADQRETSSWKCPYCKASGPCVKGQEQIALLVHLTGCNKYPPNQPKKK